MTDAYCTVEDVRRALRSANLPGDMDQDRDIAIDAIEGQATWLRKTINTHYYAPGGIAEDSDNIVPTSDRTREGEEHDIPSSPHAQHSTLFTARHDRVPHKTVGPYCRIPLSKRDVSNLTRLDVRDASGEFTDWVADPDKVTPGDYRLYIAPGESPSRAFVDLKASSLPALRHYSGGVRVSYSYGVSGIPQTIRRAVAFRAASEVVDEPAFEIPDSANVRSIESLADKFDSRADELLEPYR